MATDTATINTKQQILSIIEDIEIVTKELLDVLTAAKIQPRPSGSDYNLLLELLIQKDKDLKEALKTAEEQAEIEKTIDVLRAEVQKRDCHIETLQTNLKDAETILSAAVYQAKQKLDSVQQANRNSVASEELIKYGHRISASNAVAAPSTWAPGDPRRPYPTEFEMRLGYLGKLTNIAQSSQAHLNYSEILNASYPHAFDSMPLNATPSTMSWQQHHQEIPQSIHRQSTVDASRTHDKGDKDEVEYMSSDSSSSSSSDE